MERLFIEFKDMVYTIYSNLWHSYDVYCKDKGKQKSSRLISFLWSYATYTAATIFLSPVLALLLILEIILVLIEPAIMIGWIMLACTVTYIVVFVVLLIHFERFYRKMIWLSETSL